MPSNYLIDIDFNYYTEDQLNELYYSGVNLSLSENEKKLARSFRGYCCEHGLSHSWRLNKEEEHVVNLYESYKQYPNYFSDLKKKKKSYLDLSSLFYSKTDLFSLYLEGKPLSLDHSQLDKISVFLKGQKSNGNCLDYSCLDYSFGSRRNGMHAFKLYGSSQRYPYFLNTLERVRRNKSVIAAFKFIEPYSSSELQKLVDEGISLEFSDEPHDYFYNHVAVWAYAETRSTTDPIYYLEKQLPSHHVHYLRIRQTQKEMPKEYQQALQLEINNRLSTRLYNYVNEKISKTKNVIGGFVNNFQDVLNVFEDDDVEISSTNSKVSPEEKPDNLEEDFKAEVDCTSQEQSREITGDSAINSKNTPEEKPDNLEEDFKAPVDCTSQEQNRGITNDSVINSKITLEKKPDNSLQVFETQANTVQNQPITKLEESSTLSSEEKLNLSIINQAKIKYNLAIMQFIQKLENQFQYEDYSIESNTRMTQFNQFIDNVVSAHFNAEMDNYLKMEQQFLRSDGFNDLITSKLKSIILDKANQIFPQNLSIINLIKNILLTIFSFAGVGLAIGYYNHRHNNHYFFPVFEDSPEKNLICLELDSLPAEECSYSTAPNRKSSCNLE